MMIIVPATPRALARAHHNGMGQLRYMGSNRPLAHSLRKKMILAVSINVFSVVGTKIGDGIALQETDLAMKTGTYVSQH
jgi:hypothetical protein